MRLQKFYPISVPCFEDLDQGRWDGFLEMAAEHNNCTKAAIIDELEAGGVVWYDTDWYAKLRCGDAWQQKVEEYEARQKPIKMVNCDCGHIVEDVLVMTANRGQVCPDCYDAWSE